MRADAIAARALSAIAAMVASAARTSSSPRGVGRSSRVRMRGTSPSNDATTLRMLVPPRSMPR
jgi:hypothetical protein